MTDEMNLALAEPSAPDGGGGSPQPPEDQAATSSSSPATQDSGCDSCAETIPVSDQDSRPSSGTSSREQTLKKTTEDEEQITKDDETSFQVVPRPLVAVKLQKRSTIEKLEISEKQRNECLSYMRDQLDRQFGRSLAPVDFFSNCCGQMEFLERMFGLFDYDGDGLLNQLDWIDQLKSKCTNEKEVDFVEILETLAYVLYGDADLDKNAFLTIFTSKGVLQKLFRIVDKDNDGFVTPKDVMDFVSELSNTRRASVLTPENKDRLLELFRCHMGKDEEIRADGFKAIVNCKNPFFAERMFRIFDTDNNGTISLTEFMNSMNQFATQDTNDKLRFLFRIYDLDDDGLIDRSELSQVLRECMRENGMNFSGEQIEDLTDALFEDAHLVDKNEITFEALKAQLSRHEGLLENFSIIIDKWLVAPKKPVKPTLLQRIAACRPHYCTLPYIRNNFTYVAFVWIFLLVNLALIIHRMVVLWDHPLGFLLVIAKCCGQCLNFTSSFILVLMLRQALTWLRARGFASFLPIDQNVSLHMMCGYIIFIYGIIHTVAHLFLAGFVLLSSDLNKGKDLSYWEWMLTMKSEFGGLIPGIANVTGVVLMIIILVMVICSMPYIRKNGMFEIFYWTHLLYVPYWVLLIFHGPNYWKWFVGPAVLFILEGIGRVIRKNDKTSISSGFLLPSKVTHLVVKRPPNMYFAPGDYLFVNIPVIAKYEWHPFTISSAPEQLDSIWLHIRGVGEWTNRLYDYFKEQQEQIQATDAKVRNGSLYNQVVRKALPLRKKSTKTPERALQSIKRKISSTFRGEKQEVDIPVIANARRSGQGLHTPYAGEGYTNKTMSADETPYGTKEGAPADIAHDSHLAVLVEEGEDREEVFETDTDKIPGSSYTEENERALKRGIDRTNSQPHSDETKVKRMAVLKGTGTSVPVFDSEAVQKAQVIVGEQRPHGAAGISRSAGKSFRYMRRKPTIIRFSTPDYTEDGGEDGDAGTPKSPVEIVISNGGGNERQYETSNQVVAIEDPESGAIVPAAKPVEIYLDGPYGAPSSHIFRAQHAVLIGTGIGVTPFASILQSIMHRYWQARQTCPNCNSTFLQEIPKSVMNLKKVDFIWINRDQRAFEWFVELLSTLEIEQAELGTTMERFLDMHMYITSALQKTDMKALGLQLALELLHEKEKRDLITGLKTRTLAGRPNWDKLFKQIQDQKKGKVTVFYCGPPALGRTLRVKCDQFGFVFRKENF